MLPCRYAEIVQDGTASIIGAGIDSVWVGDLAGEVSITLMTRFSGPPDEFDEAHEFEVRLVRPDGSTEEAVRMTFGPVPRPPLYHPGMEGGLMAPVSVRWGVEEHGLCTLELYVDGARQRSLPIFIRDPADFPRPE